MARKKKSSTGGGLGLLIVGVLALLAAIPREIWIGVGVLLCICLVLYLYEQSKKKQPEAREHSASSHLLRDPPESPLPPRSTRQSMGNIGDDDDAVSPVFTTRSLVSEPTGYSVPSAPKGFGTAVWIPAGQSVQVADVTIPGGMVYVGTSLPAQHMANDPCLIDPSKSISKSGDYTVRQMSYWPSYSDITPQARRAYLTWLATGRKDPKADIGFVFLFFYGLERRAVIDASKDESVMADFPAIAAELRRLLEIYGPQSGSFRSYGSALLDWVALVELPTRLYEKPVPEFPNTYELPLYVRLALGQAAVDGTPVPAHLALSWARLDPNISLRTPARRCPDEFEKLFAEKYAELCGRGMTLPRNRTKLKLVYRPASAGMRGYDEIKLTFKDTPDVTVLTAPTKKLQAVVEAATGPLDAFSRLVGKDPNAKNSLEGYLQLPATLWPEGAKKVLDSLRLRMGDGMVAMSFQELLDNLGAKATFTRDRTLSLVRALESSAIAFEPDMLAGAKLPKPEDKIVLFSMPTSEPMSRTSGPYLVATVTLQLASAVAAADGDFSVDEMMHLRQTITSWTHLTPGQTRRLLAHLRLLMLAPASLTSLKKKFEPLELSVKETIAAFMATVAQADGVVSPDEVKMLEKVYKALGVDSKKVFSDVHAVAAGTKPTAAAVAKVEASGFKLDPARIAELQKDTERVTAMLANIFTEVEEVAATPSTELQDVEAEAEAAEAPKGLLGLDEVHTALARMMLSRPEWTREELLDVAADLDLMLDGALESINEAAFEAHDMPFVEGEDPMTVNKEILEKVEA